MVDISARENERGKARSASSRSGLLDALWVLPGKKADSGQDEERFLDAQCIDFQKQCAWFLGPIMFAISILALLGTWIWQVGLIALLLLLANMSFWRGLQIARAGEIEKSLWLVLLPVFLICLTVIGLVDGFGAVMLLTFASIVVQASVFSKRQAVSGSIGIILLLLVEQLMASYMPQARSHINPAITFWVALFVGSVMALQFLVYLRRHHDNSVASSNRNAELIEKQTRIVGAVGQTMPAIEDSVEKITGVSEDVAQRANSQARAMDAMANEVRTIMASAEGTTAHAKQSNHISFKIRGAMQDNVARLRDLSNVFETALANIQDARGIMEDLVANTDNIESILNYNRDIGEHIKVLSVNASIEAASAGEYGTGFAVVAQELRGMIENTEKNLSRSGHILSDVRTQTSAGLHAIDSTANVLSQVFAELEKTRETLVNSAESANAASLQLKQISETAESQQKELSNMSSRVDMLLGSSFDLAMSSANLTEIVSRLDDLKQTLSKTV